MKCNAFIQLIFITGMSIIMSCKKDNPTEQYSYDYLSASLKPFMFKNGSYWVYENDTTGILDSILVTGTKHDFFIQSPTGPGQTGSPVKVEYYKIELYDALNAINFNDFLLGAIITRNGTENGNSHMGQPILLSNFYIGDKLNGAQLFDTLAILNVNNNTFHEVQEMKIIYPEQTQNEFAHDTYLYFADSIGLVKKEIDLGNGNFESWSLKRWRVIL